jgi:hypothetical protein
MLIKDLIILGRACPEPLSDGRVTVCMAGWSETLGFTRIYPTRTNMPWKRWDVVEVEVEQNERDNRVESWKIAGSKEEWDKLAEKVKIVSRINSNNERRNLVANLTDDCVNIINDQKRSLGIIKPDQIFNTYFSDNPDYGELFQMGLPGLTELDTIQTKRDFRLNHAFDIAAPNAKHSRDIMIKKYLSGAFLNGLGKIQLTKSKSGKTQVLAERTRIFIYLSEIKQRIEPVFL